MALVFYASGAAIAGGNSVAETNARLSKYMNRYLTSKMVVGGDISLDFVASAPLTYNHQTGGGFYNQRIIGRDKDVVESLEGGDFACGDLVTYLTKITVSPNAVLNGKNAIELDYSFLAAATGQPGVALGAIRKAEVNAGDPAMVDNGDMAAASLNGGYNLSGDGGTISGTKFTKPATLNGTVTIGGLDRGDVIILRVDVRIDCNGMVPTGNLQASLPAGRVIGLTGKSRTISVGQQTVPFKNVNLIQQGLCLLNDISAACVNERKTFTVSGLPVTMTNPTYTWSLSNNTANAAFDPASPGSVPSVDVIAGNSGTYTVSVTVTQAGFNIPPCSRIVTVNPLPTISGLSGAMCFGANSVDMTYTLGNAANEYKIDWDGDAEATNLLADVTTYTAFPNDNDPNTLVDPIVISGLSTLPVGSYNGTIMVRNSLIGCESTNAIALLVVKTTPGMPAVAYIAPACFETEFSIRIVDYNTTSTYAVTDGNLNVMTTSSIVDNLSDPTKKDLLYTGFPAGAGYIVTETSAGGCISLPNACTAPSSKQAAPAKPVLGSAETKDLIAYPVPFSESVTVEFKATKAENYVINLYDLQGHLVRQLKAGDAKAGEIVKVQVSGTGMAESMYLVRKVSKAGISTVKLLKKQ